MAEEFSTDGMLDIYLFENEQLLEQLQERVLDQKDADCFDEDSINEIFRTMHTIKEISAQFLPQSVKNGMDGAFCTAVHQKCQKQFFTFQEKSQQDFL